MMDGVAAAGSPGLDARDVSRRVDCPEDEEPVTQKFGALRPTRLDLAPDLRHRSVSALNRLLAHAMAMRDLYKKAHWQTSGATFYALHVLFDKHYQQQLEVIDLLAERVQTLGGVALALAMDVVEESRIARAPRGREAPDRRLQRLLDAHEFVLKEARALARKAAAGGDDGTADLIVGSLVRPYELQSWFVNEHLSSMDIPKPERAVILESMGSATRGGDSPPAH